MSKKLLAPMDLKNPTRIKRGWLVPNQQLDGFVEIVSGKSFESGLVVFAGRAVGVDDILAKANLSSQFRCDTNTITEMLNQIGKFKIGDIVGIRTREGGLELIRLEKPPRTTSKIPQ